MSLGRISEKKFHIGCHETLRRDIHYEGWKNNHGRTHGGFIPPKLPKLGLTSNTEYVANLVNVSMWFKRATVQFITRVYAMQNDIFLTDIAGYDRLKFS